MEPERRQQRGDGLEAFRKWLTPVLIVVSGFFIGRKLDEIDKKMELVTVVQTAQAVLRAEMDNVKDNYKALKQDLDDHKRIADDPLYQDAQRNINKKVR